MLSLEESLTGFQWFYIFILLSHITIIVLKEKENNRKHRNEKIIIIIIQPSTLDLFRVYTVIFIKNYILIWILRLYLDWEIMENQQC